MRTIEEIIRQIVREEIAAAGLADGSIHNEADEADKEAVSHPATGRAAGGGLHDDRGLYIAPIGPQPPSRLDRTPI